MRIEKANSVQNFQGLNIRKVLRAHKHFIDADYEKLKEFGDKYDISMKSYIDSEDYCDGIEITVRDLRKNLGFFRKFFRPKGTSYFYTTPHYTAESKNMTFVGQIQKAVEDLDTKSVIGRKY